MIALFAGAVSATDCNHDNVLRCLLRSSVVATPFCSSYLSIPFVIQTMSAAFVNLSIRGPVYWRVCRTTSVGPPPKREITNDQNEPQNVPHITKRADASPSATPACLSQASYPESRISSACSCISVATSTTTTTAASQPTDFSIVAHAPGYGVDGCYLGGAQQSDGYYTWFNNTGSRTYSFSLDQNGALFSQTVYIQAFYRTANLAWVLTETLGHDQDPPAYTPITCTVDSDQNLKCRTSTGLTEFQVWQQNEGNTYNLAIAKVDDRSLRYFVTKVDLSVKFN